MSDARRLSHSVTLWGNRLVCFGIGSGVFLLLVIEAVEYPTDHDGHAAQEQLTSECLRVKTSRMEGSTTPEFEGIVLVIAAVSLQLAGCTHRAFPDPSPRLAWN